jgi:hypothetical protein
MRFKRVIIAMLTAFVVLLTLAYGALFWPLPIERTLKTETSPDGTRVAVYSWRPCGFVGVFTRDNPWVYLTLRDKASGNLIARHSFWADVPEEAEERLADHRPW